MSIKKIALGFALAGMLGATAAVAEEDSWFAGAYLGHRSVSVKTECKDSEYCGYYRGGTASSSGMKYGILAGYHSKISEELGLRYYGAGDLGDYTTNFNANVDVLYSFFKNDIAEIRVFGGGWLGYANHDSAVSGFDLGLNVGVRAVFVQRHGAEFYGHFGFLSQDIETNIYGIKIVNKISQPYQIGLRYTFSF